MVMEMSKTYQYRKVMKPLLERKRRARINKCLDDLKDLMVECLTQEGEHVTRLEKADILELTVEHMRKLKQRGNLALRATTTLNAHVESFRSGYVHAADQISQVLLQQYIDDEVKGKLMKFLSSRLIDMQHNVLMHSSTATSSSTPSNTAPSPTAPDLQKTFFENVIFRDQQLNTKATPAPSSLQYSATKIMPVTNNSHPDELKENDMIDIVTVDTCNNSMNTTSALCNDLSGGEHVWRPWQKETTEMCKI